MRLRPVLAVAILLTPMHVHAGDLATAPRFETDVLPILNAHCLQCHGGVHQKNDLDLRTLATALKGGTSGTVIVPGKPDESLLWGWKSGGASGRAAATACRRSSAGSVVCLDWRPLGSHGQSSVSGWRPRGPPPCV